MKSIFAILVFTGLGFVAFSQNTSDLDNKIFSLKENDFIKKQYSDDSLYFMHYKKAAVLYNSGKFEQALRELKTSISLNSKYFYSYALRGGINNQIGNYEDAISDYSNAIEFSDIDTNKAYFVSSFYLAIAKIKFKLKRFDEALFNFDIAIAKDTNNMEVYFQRGYVNFQENKYAEAISDFTKAIEGRNEEGYVYYLRGKSKLMLNDFRGAIVDFSVAIKKSPNNDKSELSYFLFRGFAKSNLNDHRGAILDFNLAIKKEPKKGSIYYRRGLSKVFLERIDSGCLDFSKAGELGHKKAYSAIKEYCN